MKLYAVSDLHVEQPDNRAWLYGLSRTAWRNDALIVAGDIGHRPGDVVSSLAALRERFARVLFVPGNHELWHRGGSALDGVERLERLLETCHSLGVDTAPVRLCGARHAVWVVPLQAWYAGACERELSLWSDPGTGIDPWALWRESLLVRWPAEVADRPAQWMLERNRPWLAADWDAPVITFSHFLPRRELMVPPPGSVVARAPRRRTSFGVIAGCSALDDQIRAVNARVHIYGHQHRNQRRTIHGIDYLSCCLGHPRERAAGYTSGITAGPQLVWCGARGFAVDNPVVNGWPSSTRVSVGAHSHQIGVCP